uniref:ATP synthase subunit a n=1 Tax=Hylica paradoxa TaxID=2027056 RepID=A0A7T6YCR4_9HEMI|nr:ATP synthase F0 subunit 6 [Hylica paradoxa]QQK57685.1 ATP synthase F0 subunit 6 [Hylica paradoxa]
MKMMTNLFSTFDPSTGMISLNWLSIMSVMMFPKKYWTMNNTFTITTKNLLKLMNKEIKSANNIKGAELIMNSILMFIMSINLMGLLPYVFTPSSHMTFSLSISLPIWMSMIMFGWTKKTKKMLKHMVPMGTPFVLSPFMVIIETISNLIRPTSLAVRLSANMIAGHILMSLLGNSSKSIMIMLTLLSMYTILMLFEMAVAIIQSYVFMTLSSLYSSEM